MIGRPGGFEEAFGAEFHGVGDSRGGERTPFDGGRRQRNASVCGPGQEESHCPVAVNGMRAEERKGVGVARSEESVDLSVEARIAGSNRCRVLRGWALLRQVNGLREVARDGQMSLVLNLAYVP